MLREIKPRNARTARIVKAREPQILEARKRILLLHGTKCPQPVNTVLKTITTLTKPHSLLFNKKNENIHPFENVGSLEFLAGKNDCAMVVFGTHSKKRPNNITVCRMFDGKVLDMVELLLQVPPHEIESKPRQMQIGVEMKPLILFAGAPWADTSSSSQSAIYATLKSLFLDLFCGEEITSIDVAGLQYILLIAAPEPTSNASELADHPLIHLRWYKIRTKRSGQKLPRVELDPAGPTIDFRVGRIREADAATMKEALKKARGSNEARTKKNIDTDLVGDKMGRVHLGKQDLATLQTRKMKGLKRTRHDDGDVEGDEEENLDVDMDEGSADVDEISQGDDEEIELFDDEDENELPKRQRLA